MNIQFMKRRMLIFAFVFLLIAGTCASCAGNEDSPSDYVIVLTTSATEDLSPYFTEAAETIFAQISETALAQPTQTPVPPTETVIPSNTPTNTATIKPTIAYVWVPTVNYTNTPLSVTPSITVTAASYSCSITSQLVSDGAEFKTSEEFDASWTVKNTGSVAWDASEIDYRYVSGTSMHKFNAVYDFSTSVASGESITITVDMITPSSAANYETFWAISHSSVNFCSLPLRIKVVE